MMQINKIFTNNNFPKFYIATANLKNQSKRNLILQQTSVTTQLKPSYSDKLLQDYLWYNIQMWKIGQLHFGDWSSFFTIKPISCINSIGIWLSTSDVFHLRSYNRGSIRKYISKKLRRVTIQVCFKRSWTYETYVFVHFHKGLSWVCFFLNISEFMVLQNVRFSSRYFLQLFDFFIGVILDH